MTLFFRQSSTSSRICHYLAGLALLAFFFSAYAGEEAVDPTDNGVDILQDSTPDIDSRSSASSVAAENLLVPETTRVYMGPLADAVTDAESLAAPLHFLGSEIEPGTTQRLSWSATDEKVDVARKSVDGGYVDSMSE
jgi:hypothetical protein